VETDPVFFLVNRLETAAASCLISMKFFAAEYVAASAPI
jgi:hypothetical protein